MYVAQGNAHYLNIDTRKNRAKKTNLHHCAVLYSRRATATLRLHDGKELLNIKLRLNFSEVSFRPSVRKYLRLSTVAQNFKNNGVLVTSYCTRADIRINEKNCNANEPGYGRVNLFLLTVFLLYALASSRNH